MRFKYFINESQSIVYKVLTENELYKLAKKDFGEVAQRIKYFGATHSSQTFITAYDEKTEKIVGILKLGIASGYNHSQEQRDSHKGVYFVSVDPKYKQLGIAKQLIKMMFELAIKRKFAIHMSSYTQQGRKYIAPIIDKMKKQFPEVEIEESPFSDYQDDE